MTTTDANRAVIDSLVAPTPFVGTIAVSYLRVSTKEQAEKGGSAEGFSIPAQREANQRSNEIEFTTRIDTAELQRQVNRAAAQITPPAQSPNQCSTFSSRTTRGASDGATRMRQTWPERSANFSPLPMAAKGP